MNKGAKTFDCLRMKRAIQANLEKEWGGLTTDEIQAAIRRKLATSQSDLAKWWRKLEASQGKKNRKP